MNELEAARRTIDQVDRQMAALFEARMEAVGRVAAYKQAHDLPVLDAGREAQVLEKNLALLQNKELAPYYADYIRHQMALSRQYQTKVLGRDTVAYQGVEGAFSHIALKQLFPRARALAFATWGEVFQAVSAGRAAFGVLPFENSHAGDVAAVLDLCYAHKDIFVTAVYDLPVRQNLLGLPGAKLSDIRRVYSHPQAIAQSERFLKSLGLPAESCANTALAAKQVAEGADKSLGAIASAETAALYGLSVLAADINSDGDNTTRFIVISRTRPVEGDRFSLLFTVEHKAGMLARVIQSIGAAGFNMESIKSRPKPGVPFEYYFYVELVGRPGADDARALLEELAAVCDTVRVLGVFFRSAGDGAAAGKE
ncbi:MAG TPA: chorismate mutase [Candidatus Fournierella merdigallinarum]|nr:chorismate mutase [Candidatus Fournierella merdigallinarum]